MITAVRNSADTIERTIRSVLNQNYPELQQNPKFGKRRYYDAKCFDDKEIQL